MPHAPTSPPEYWDLYKPYKGVGVEPRPAAGSFGWTPVEGHGPSAEPLFPCESALELGAWRGRAGRLPRSSRCDRHRCGLLRCPGRAGPALLGGRPGAGLRPRGRARVSGRCLRHLRRHLLPLGGDMVHRSGGTDAARTESSEPWRSARLRPRRARRTGARPAADMRARPATRVSTRARARVRASGGRCRGPRPRRTGRALRRRR